MESGHWELVIAGILGGGVTKGFDLLMRWQEQRSQLGIKQSTAEQDEADRKQARELTGAEKAMAIISGHMDTILEANNMLKKHMEESQALCEQEKVSLTKRIAELLEEKTALSKRIS